MYMYVCGYVCVCVCVSGCVTMWPSDESTSLLVVRFQVRAPPVTTDLFRHCTQTQVRKLVN